MSTIITGYSCAGEEKGGLSPEKTKYLPALIIGLGMGLGIQWTIDPESFDPAETEESFKAMIRAYIT